MNCDCVEILKLKIKEGHFTSHAFLELPTFDVALSLKFLNDKNWTEKNYWDLCQGFGNTNYCGLVAEMQICIAAFEIYTIDEILDMLQIRDNHLKHE